MNYQAVAKLIVSIQKQDSIPKLEVLISETIPFIKKLKIVLNKNNEHLALLKNQKDAFLFEQSLQNSKELPIKLVWIKNSSFLDAELELCKKIGSFLKMNISNIVDLENTLHKTWQWETIFNSINTPIALTDKNFDLILYNSNFIKTCLLYTSPSPRDS